MTRILLCPPTYYDIEYEINPWMHKENKVNRKKVQQTYDTIKNLYKTLGADIYEIPPVQGLPDLVYMANNGFVKDGTFIPATFKFEERRGEAKAGIDYFETLFGYKTRQLPEQIFYEGQADLVQVGNKYFFGYGKRTVKEAKRYLENIMNVELIALELVDPYYYHLDTAFAPLSDTIALYNPSSFTDQGRRILEQNFPYLIATTEEDNKHMACNLVKIDKHIIVNKGITDFTKDTIESCGFTVHTVDMSEYLKGGGSVKCISFLF